MQRISVIIPALNEAANIVALLAALHPLRRLGHQIILVDGGSTDRTAQLAAPWCDHVLTAPRGRAAQMNVGAAKATGDLLWFLHADSPPGPPVLHQIRTVAGGRGAWGRFDVRLGGDAWLLRVVSWSMNLRSRLSGICTGDQGIFVRRELFQRLGGYADISLMEDIELCTRLRRIARPRCLPGPLLTSSRRWEQAGILRTILLMWRLRLAYFLGADPVQLARRYRGPS